MKVDLAQLKTSWGGVLVVLVDKLNKRRGDGSGNFETFSNPPPFFLNGDILILYVLGPENVRNVMKKNYHQGHVKRNWIFSKPSPSLFYFVYV